MNKLYSCVSQDLRQIQLDDSLDNVTARLRKDELYKNVIEHKK